MINLLTNAIKFTPDGGRSLGVRRRPRATTVVIRVADTGMGIPTDEQERIFERFFRSSSAQRLAVPGTGLGLSITRAIIEEHGGSHLGGVPTGGGHRGDGASAGGHVAPLRRDRGVGAGGGSLTSGSVGRRGASRALTSDAWGVSSPTPGPAAPRRRRPRRSAPRARRPPGLPRSRPGRHRSTRALRRRAGDRQDPAGPGAGRAGPGRRHGRRLGTLRRGGGRARLLAVAPGAALARPRPDAVAGRATSSRPRTGSGSSTRSPRRCWRRRRPDGAWSSSSTTSTGPTSRRSSSSATSPTRSAAARLLVFATFRDVEPASLLPRLLPDLLRSPAVERLDLRGFGLAEVRGAAAGRTAGGATDRRRPGRPRRHRRQPAVRAARSPGPWPTARGGPTGRPAPCSTSSGPGSTGSPPSAAGWCRRRPSSGATSRCRWWRRRSTRPSSAACRSSTRPSATAWSTGSARPTAATTGSSTPSPGRRSRRRSPPPSGSGLHRAVAEATEATSPADLSEHLADIARHWAELAPYGEAATARPWAVRAADDAVRRLAYEEGVRLYRAALALAGPIVRRRAVPGPARPRPGRLPGRRPPGCVEPPWPRPRPPGPRPVARAPGRGRARPRGRPRSRRQRRRQAAVRAGAGRPRRLGAARGAAGPAARPAQPPRLLRRRAGRIEALSAAALDLRPGGGRRPGPRRRPARPAGGVPGAGRRVRAAAAGGEMLALAQRTNSARTAMWGELWRIEALIERRTAGAPAADALPGLQVAVERVGGPGQRVAPRPGDRLHRPGPGPLRRRRRRRPRGFERMRPRRAGPGRGRLLRPPVRPRRPHRCHRRRRPPSPDRPFDPPPRFRTMARDLTCAAAAVRRASRRGGRLLPAGGAGRDLVAARLLRPPRLRVRRPGLQPASAATTTWPGLLDRLEPFRGEHVVGDGVAYMGPVELTLGRGAAALGRLDQAIDDLDRRRRAGRAGRRTRLRRRGPLPPGDGAGRPRPARRPRPGRRPPPGTPTAWPEPSGMAAYVDRTAALVARLTSTGAARPAALSPREAEVAHARRRGPHQPPDRRAAGHLGAHRPEPRAAHPRPSSASPPGARSRRGACGALGRGMSRRMSHPADCWKSPAIRSVSSCGRPGRTQRRKPCVDHRRHPALRVDRRRSTR